MGLAGALTLQPQEATVFLIPQQQKGAGLVTNFQQILHFICIVNQSLLSALRLSQSPGSSCSLPSITFSKKACASVSSFHHTSATPLGDMALGRTSHYPICVYMCVHARTHTHTYTHTRTHTRTHFFPGTISLSPLFFTTLFCHNWL